MGVRVPSGLDDALATYGGLCLFRPGGWEAVPTRLDGLEVERKDEKTLRIEGLELPGLLVAHSGAPHDTGKVVKSVGRLKQTRPELAARLFAGMEECLWQGFEALRTADWHKLGRAMTRNHELLQRLGVSTPRLDELVEAALASGAFGAKLTGAGGGGAVLVLAPGREREVAGALRAAGWRVWRLRQGRKWRLAG